MGENRPRFLLVVNTFAVANPGMFEKAIIRKAPVVEALSET